MSGSGSVRVQVTSPGDGSEVIHVTQARVPDIETLDATAAALAAVLGRQPEGLDGGVRIAIGCQGTGPVPQGACDRAIRSAHGVERK
jgi:hypothetical protein